MRIYFKNLLWKNYYQLQIGSKEIFNDLGFTSGSRKILEGLLVALKKYANIQGGSLCYASGYRLCFSTHDSLMLYNFMYQQGKDLYLERKKSIFKHYFEKILGA